MPPGEEVFYAGSKDTKEAFDLSLDLPDSDPDYLAGNRLLGPNRWPLEVTNFRARVDAYYAAVTALGRRLLRGFLLALELPENHFDHALHKPPSQLRLIHYPYQASADDAPGIGAHTDYECFTILHATRPGLEVLNAKGVWVDAPPVSGAFVINIGDLLEVLSNGRWVSTAHRVRKVRGRALLGALVLQPRLRRGDRALPALGARRRASALPEGAGRRTPARADRTKLFVHEAPNRTRRNGAARGRARPGLVRP